MYKHGDVSKLWEVKMKYRMSCHNLSVRQTLGDPKIDLLLTTQLLFEGKKTQTFYLCRHPKTVNINPNRCDIT